MHHQIINSINLKKLNYDVEKSNPIKCVFKLVFEIFIFDADHVSYFQF